MHTMVSHCIENLSEIKSFLSKLTKVQYVHKCDSLSGASIGQHIRHILEFYLCLLKGVHHGEINYDNRDRDILLETDPNFAILCVDGLLSNIHILPTKIPIRLVGNYCNEDAQEISIQSSVERELVYCLEHAIHHMALIKVATIDQSIIEKVGANFGVAPSTIRNRSESCAR